MKSLFLALLLACSLGWAIDTAEHCGTTAGVPADACTIQGYIGTLAYDGLISPTDNSAAILSFNIMDKDGNALALKKWAKTRVFYYIEASKASDALGMVTFTSLALSAYNNKTPVNVIYVNDAENSAAVFLLALQLLPQPE